MNNPLVSIIVPCYNHAQYLHDALQSVLDQTYKNWECIVVNDGSLDNTEEIAQKWVSKDSRFIYLKKENGGLSNARNAGIEVAQGEFILPLDADDKIAGNYVDLAMRSFKADSSLKVVYSKAEKFGNENGPWDLKPFSLYGLTQDNMIFCSAFFKKSDWQLVGGYDPKMIHGLEDFEFWISILKNGGNVKCLDAICFYYRIKSDSMVKRMSKKEVKQIFEYLSIKHADFYVSHYGSFVVLNNKLKQERNHFSAKLKSKKFVIDLFCRTFFGFSFFGTGKTE